MASLARGDPSHIGGYALAGRLGAGGQGVVYDAYDGLGTRVALKVVSAVRLGNPEHQARFAKEALAARKVASFCTARIIAVDLDGDPPYIVSEYIPGVTLQQAVDENDGYPPSDLHRLATGVATALTAIHGACVVHRDLKPTNVILGPDGPRVIDFGVARIDGVTLTADRGRPVGTPAYMSPEQTRNEQVGPETDVWAWGAMMLFAATGKPPFGVGSLAEVHARITHSRPDLSCLQGTLRKLVAAALVLDPAHRPTAESLLLTLVGSRQPAVPLLEAGRSAAGGFTTTDTTDRSLDDVAEEVYHRLDPDQRQHVPRVLLRLVVPGDGADNALRHVPAAHLVTGDAQTSLLDRFVEAGLVRREDDLVTLTSVALTFAWHRMRRWLDNTHNALRAQGRLYEAALAWEAGGRSAQDLFRGTLLHTALERTGDGGDGLLTLLPLERAFLDASANQELRQRRIRRRVTAGLALLLTLALIAVCVAVLRAMSENRQREVLAAVAAAGQATALRATAPRQALLLSVAAWRLAPEEPAVRAALHGSLAQLETQVLHPPTTRGPSSHAIGDDGSHATLNAGTAIVTDVTSGMQMSRIGRMPGGSGSTALSPIALSPDGGTLAVAAPGSIQLWDVDHAHLSGHLPEADARELSFDRAGRWLIVRDTAQVWRVWSLADRRTQLFEEKNPGVVDIEVSPDGASVVKLFQDGSYLVETRSGDQHRPGGLRPANGVAAAFSPDGRTVAVDDGADVRFWGLRRRGWQEAELLGASARSIVYSRDGAHLATYDGTAVSLWTAGGVRLLRHRILGVRDDVRFGPGDESLLCLLTDGSVTRLDVKGLTRPHVLVPGTRSGALSLDARHAVLEGSASRLIDAETGRTLKELPAVAVPGGPMAFSGDGSLLAMGRADPPSVTVWDVPRREQVRVLPLRTDRVGGLSFDPVSGSLAIATVDQDWRPIQLWDPRRGHFVKELRQVGGAEMAFSPDGLRLVVNGLGAVYDVTTGTAVAMPFGTGQDGIVANAFSRDGATIATGLTDVGVDLWDSREIRPIRRLPLAPDESDQLFVAAFAPGGGLLAAGTGSGRIWLWDTATGTLLGDPVMAHAGRVLALAFTPDGKFLRSLGTDGAVAALPIDPPDVAAAVCRRAGGTLTEQQWREHIPAVPYRQVC